MKKMELEVKILDINKEKFIEKLEKLGAKFVSETKQVLYTYDLPTIYGRYIDLLIQVNYPESKIKYETTLEKLKLLFFEVDNLMSENDKCTLKEIIMEEQLTKIVDKENLKDILNDCRLIDFMKKFHINPKKWIRLRQTNDKTTLTVKHIFANNTTDIQQLQEVEIEVPSLKEANQLLEILGFSYKSYQEKTRITYLLNEHEIDIDSWPGIPPYFEVEGKSVEDLKCFLSSIGYDIKNAVSCTADDIYLKYGKSMFDKKELKFEDYNE